MKEQFDSRDVMRLLLVFATGLQEASPSARKKAVDVIKKAMWRASGIIKRDLEAKAKEGGEANK